MRQEWGVLENLFSFIWNFNFWFKYPISILFVSFRQSTFILADCTDMVHIRVYLNTWILLLVYLISFIQHPTEHQIISNTNITMFTPLPPHYPAKWKMALHLLCDLVFKRHLEKWTQNALSWRCKDFTYTLVNPKGFISQKSLLGEKKSKYTVHVTPDNHIPSNSDIKDSSSQY